MSDDGALAEAGWWGCAALLIVGFFIALFGGTLFVMNNLGLQGDLAKIEQLRVDSAHVDPAQAEDVIGQVVEWNLKITTAQTYNHIWWAGWTIPDEWDNVQLIPVPHVQ